MRGARSGLLAQEVPTTITNEARAIVRCTISSFLWRARGSAEHSERAGFRPFPGAVREPGAGVHLSNGAPGLRARSIRPRRGRGRAPAVPSSGRAMAPRGPELAPEAAEWMNARRKRRAISESGGRSPRRSASGRWIRRRDWRPGSSRSFGPGVIATAIRRASSRAAGTDMPRGGHFAAMQQPELYIADLRRFFATVRR